MNESIPIYASFTSINQVTFPNDLKFRVYYLEAPLGFLKEKIGIEYINNKLTVNGFHTGIGFQSIDESRHFELTLEAIVAKGFLISSLLPKITGSGDEGILEWNNQAEIKIGSSIDISYWQKSTYVCTINSDQLLKIENWVLNNWIPNNPNYCLLSAINSISKEDIFNPIFRSSICDTFCYSILFFIQGVNGGDQTDPMAELNKTNNKLKVNIENVTPLNISILAFLSNG